MQAVQHFDLVIIGSGPGGYKAALTAANLGARVALVERGLYGGVCLNQGCIPKQTLLHLASLIEDVRELQGRGLTGAIQGDFPAAMAHKNEVVESIRDNFGVWLKRLGVRMFQGQATLEGSRAVRVESSAPGEAALTLEGDRIVIATGSGPRELPSCPTDGVTVLDSRDFMFRLNRLPRNVLCVGGGAIGVELGFLLHQFGARVTIAEISDRLLNSPRIPARAATMLERKFTRIGIEVRKNLTVRDCAVRAGMASITFTDDTRADYDLVLVGIGRRPNTEGLEQAGVKLGAEGFVDVNEYLETSLPDVYAIGDVRDGPMTANAALHDAKVVAMNTVSNARMRANYYKVPVVVHSAYEIAAVGLSEEQAEAAGFTPEVARTNLRGSGKARAHHDYEGFYEVVHDAETGQLLGGCIVGPEAGEQIHVLAAACQSERGLWLFKDLSYSHPSWCEELETAIDSLTATLAKSDKDLFRPGIFAYH